MKRLIEPPAPPTLSRRKAKPFRPFAKVVLALFALPLIYLLLHYSWTHGGWPAALAVVIVALAELVIVGYMKRMDRRLKIALGVLIPLLAAGAVIAVKAFF